jgi:DNA-directed RNA polymerase specialized sigma24 family protein
MRTEEHFDSFYLKTRRALVHQTFALTGDLPAAQRAVRDAYVAAWHHWRKVGTYADPVGWVRPRAWAQAQRRHSARLWHRNRTLSDRERAVLDALHQLTGAERRALLLVELADREPEQAARELGVTSDSLVRDHAAGAAKTAVTLRTTADSLPAVLGELAGTATEAELPRAAVVRREGTVRRRWHTLVAAAATALVAVGAGALAHEPVAGPAPEAAAPSTPTASPSATAAGPTGTPEPQLPTAEDLLTTRQVARLAPGARWRSVGTHDNTEGNGINYVCQQKRFADPDGLSTLVRDLTTGGRAPREVTQVLEISDSASAAEATYAQVLGWFAECPEGQVHLRRTFDVRGAADEATLLQLESWARPTGYSVALARVGQTVTTTVVRSRGNAPPATADLVGVLRSSTASLCERTGDDACRDRVRVRPAPPPEPADPTGMLTTIDMPPIPGVRQPWVGTSPAPLRGNPAATSCDRAGFRPQGARDTRIRTFLVPKAGLPERFGLTEVVGDFRDPSAAAGFLASVRDSVAGCEDRDLATQVEAGSSLRTGPVVGSWWRLRTELSDTEEVVYQVGFVRRGSEVAQVTFVPGGPGQLSPGDFRAVLVRAGERLAEEPS